MTAKFGRHYSYISNELMDYVLIQGYKKIVEDELLIEKYEQGK